MFRKAFSFFKASTVLAVATLAMLQLQGCSGGSSGGTSTSTGTLKVAITDSPAFRDFSSVHINVTKVVVVPAGKENQIDDDFSGLITVAEYPDGKDIDILKLHFLQEALGDEVLMPVGNYNQIRLILAANPAAAPFKNYFILSEPGSQPVALTTPSAQKTGVKINGHFTVEPGILTTVLLDFNPNEAIVKRGSTGKNNLKPHGVTMMQVLNNMNTASSASISGLIKSPSFQPFSSALVSIKPREPAGAAVSAGAIYGIYSGSGFWKAPFVAYVPPCNSTVMPSLKYRVFVQGYRNSQLQSAIFQLYSSPLIEANTLGVDYPVPPNSIVTLTP